MGSRVVIDESGTDTIDEPFAGQDERPSFAPAAPVLVDREDETQCERPRGRSKSILGSVLDGRFRIVEQIGEGGMGLVYRGVQLSIERPVAIKVIRGQLIHDVTSAKRFLREARILTVLSHPNIVHVLELGETDDRGLYLVMELVRGRTLDGELAHTRRFDAVRTAEVALQLCAALAAAHAHGIVHRDLKPANIMLSADLGGRDLVKVLDFGVAKSLAAFRRTGVTELTALGAIIGTPQYMSPEAASGETVDARSDLYALGCIMHEMLSGTSPFADDAIHTVMARHVSEPAPTLPHDVPPPLARIIHALLEKSPARRPDSAAAVHAELSAFLRAGIDPRAHQDEAPTAPWRSDAAARRAPTLVVAGRQRAPVWLGLLALAAAALFVSLLAVALR